MQQPVEQQVQTLNPLQNVGVAIVIFYVFGIFSALIDKLVFLAPFRVMLLAALAGLSIVALTGRLIGLIKHRVGLSLIIFSVWMVFCIPTSVWPGGAFRTFTDEWQKAALTFFLVGGLIVNHIHCRKLIHTLGYAAIVLATMSIALGGNVVGRLVLQNTRYSNPNDLGMILLTAVPALAYMVVRPGNGLRRVVALFGGLPVLLAIAKTGSRAAIIGAGMMMLIVFIQASMANKIKLLAACVLGLGLCAVVLPGDLQQRFFTLFGDEEALASGEADMHTIGSTHSRKELLYDSLRVTAKNPIFGVGPGMFPVAQDRIARDRGDTMGQWHVTHNTYTQVSSECGIPGLIFFLFAVIGSFQSLKRIRQINLPGPEWDDMRMMANTLRISMLCFCTIAMFASVAYLPFLTVLAGLTVGLEYAAGQVRWVPVKPPATSPVPSKAGRSPQLSTA